VVTQCGDDALDAVTDAVLRIAVDQRVKLAGFDSREDARRRWNSLASNRR
jgi:hypothetical protein